MGTTGIEQRKLRLISQLVRTEDPEIIAKVEELLSEVGVSPYAGFSEEEVRYRISRAEKDIAEGNTLTQEEAERESEKWGK
ncbi:MAG: hypothetical protein RL266_800 [Bacteroidota bacterium]|jgi:hypothetical protein